MRIRRRLLSCPPLLWLCLAILGCRPAAETTPARSAEHSPSHAPEASRWPAADRIFRADPRWLGGDAAVSIALGRDRTLWLFGDSFVGGGDSGDRRGAAMIRNSVAIQRGSDPVRAEMEFHFRPGPGSFFPEQGDDWFWPQHGIVVDGQLTLFLYRLTEDPGQALGFRYVGWSALRVEEPSLAPDRWAPSALEVPDVSPIEMVGVSVLSEGDHVYAYGVREPGDHAVYVLRWTRTAFAAGDLGDPHVWAGPSRGWTRGPPRALIDAGQTEFSVVTRPGGGFRMVHTVGFGASELVVRDAPAPQGPFSDPVTVLRPPEWSRQNVLIYGARAHAQLSTSGAALAVTYNANSLDADALLGDLSLYVPRFVRVSW